MRASMATLVALTAVVMGVVGCTRTSGGGQADAACAVVIEYENRRYGNVANVDFTPGDRLGTATHKSCADGHGMPEDWTTGAYEVEGLDPEVAIAVGDTPDDVLFVAVDAHGELPAEVCERLPSQACPSSTA
ncbi:DUF6281 family protein [Streptomyces sp. TRM68416]|uniref:DUF6281 family protein n=1 Tax=Streptomyces sp. TRM68416 TaxID=2758412 RepID=UPI001661D508|nr:DUF6281 family protein [Streptomyces sp. TRM68416]MBD0842798.1 hypothetical protein [Streptomyces sp. TRM68416]